MRLRDVNMLPSALFRLAASHRRNFTHRLLIQVSELAATRPAISERMSLVTDSLSARKLMILFKKANSCSSCRALASVSNAILNDYISCWRYYRSLCSGPLVGLLPLAVRYSDQQHIVKLLLDIITGDGFSAHADLYETLEALVRNKASPRAKVEMLICQLFQRGNLSSVLQLSRSFSPSETLLSTLMKSAMPEGRLDFCQSLVANLRTNVLQRIGKTIMLEAFTSNYASLSEYSQTTLTFLFNCPPPNYNAKHNILALLVAVGLHDIILVRKILDTSRCDMPVDLYTALSTAIRKTGICI
jgi:hypothetical protein